MHEHSSTATVKIMAISSAVDIAYAHKSCSSPQLIFGLDIETLGWDEPLTVAKESIRVVCIYHTVSHYFRYDLRHSMLTSIGMSTAVAPYQLNDAL